MANTKFEELFFVNQRRLNIKICSDNHAKNTKEIEDAVAENKKFYAEFGANQKKIKEVQAFAEENERFS